MKILTWLVLVSFLGNTFAIPAQAETPATGVIHVNPESLRVTLIDHNNSVLDGLNQVYQAKDQVNIARADLLPSVNLSMILSPTFLISTVAFLLPFLLPGNWVILKEDQTILAAEEVSYHLVQLNQYASAYAMYETIVGDLDLRAVYQQQYLALQSVYQSLQNQNQAYGTVSPKDLDQAQAQAQIAAIQVSQADKMLAQEKAAMRQLIAAPLDQDIQFDGVHVGASASESTSPADLLTQALAIAPENEQIDDLISASESAKWVKIFGFLTTSTLGTVSSGAGSGSSVSFGKLQQSTSMTLGFAIAPTIALSNDNTDELYLQKDSLKQQEGEIIESTLSSITEVKKELGLALQAEANLNQVYQIEVQKYNYGLTDLLHVLTAENEVTTASVSRVESQLDLDNLRISLHRLMLTDQFAKIKGCQANAAVNPSGGFLGGIFGGRNRQNETVDEACHPTGDADSSTDASLN